MLQKQRLSVQHSGQKLRESPPSRNTIFNQLRASDTHTPMNILQELRQNNFNTVSLPSINKSPHQSVLNIIDYSQT